MKAEQKKKKWKLEEKEEENINLESLKREK